MHQKASHRDGNDLGRRFRKREQRADLVEIQGEHRQTHIAGGRAESRRIRDGDHRERVQLVAAKPHADLVVQKGFQLLAEKIEGIRVVEPYASERDNHHAVLVGAILEFFVIFTPAEIPVLGVLRVLVEIAGDIHVLLADQRERLERGISPNSQGNHRIDERLAAVVRRCIGRLRAVLRFCLVRQILVWKFQIVDHFRRLCGVAPFRRAESLEGKARQQDDRRRIAGLAPVVGIQNREFFGFSAAHAVEHELGQHLSHAHFGKRLEPFRKVGIGVGLQMPALAVSEGDPRSRGRLEISGSRYFLHIEQFETGVERAALADFQHLLAVKAATPDDAWHEAVRTEFGEIENLAVVLHERARRHLFDNRLDLPAGVTDVPDRLQDEIPVRFVDGFRIDAVF
ncbi:MAG: hypothetical protein BWY66_00917 [bacterium ADurb.Bin374]|nr:MAG: hypothetical protein BWY66_00917 [bacterium ADurb.Bin374]